MKAWTYSRYGDESALELSDVPRPTPAPGEVLVNVQATALNAADRHLLAGSPALVRLSTGLGSGPRRPRIIGSDIAGVIEQVGDQVEGFSAGDRVHAEVDSGGAAEFIAVKQSALNPLPEDITFVDGAAIGMAAITAVHAVREGGRVSRGDTVVVNGASGGVGTFAVQLARAAGASVIGVTSAKNVELVRGLGAEQVIAYDEKDFSNEVHGVEVFIDIVGDRTLRDLRSHVADRGTVVMVGGGGGPILGPIGQVLGASALNLFSRKRLHFVMDSRANGDDLRYVVDLVRQGKLRPVLDRVVPFTETPDAVRHLRSRRAAGKIVITI